MQNTYSHDEMKQIFNSEVIAFETLRRKGRSRVCVYYSDGRKNLLWENKRGFFEIILNSTGISVPHRIHLAEDIVREKHRDPQKKETAVRLSPIFIKPGQAFMGFQRKQGPLYICRSIIN